MGEVKKLNFCTDFFPIISKINNYIIGNLVQEWRCVGTMSGWCRINIGAGSMVNSNSAGVTSVL